MAAVEMVETLREVGPSVRPLRLVAASEAVGRSRTLSQRRVARARQVRRRNRFVAGVALVMALGVLAMPGTSFGGVTDTGLPTDLATGTVLTSGTTYVVQSGDSVNSIARRVNPLNVARARAILEREIGSKVVVPGEHVLIP